jgi:hypothetical protein
MGLNKRSEKGSRLSWIEVDSNWTTIENWLAGKAALNHTHSIANVIGLQNALDARVLNSQKAVANGVATLGSDGIVPSSQLPPMVGSGMFFPHETLTGEDIGKLVIWKDGKATLPIFEEAQEAQPKIMQFTSNLAGFHEFVPDEVHLEFTLNPSDGDILTIDSSHIFTFKDSPSPFTFDIQRGVTIKDSIDNLLAADKFDASYVIVRDTDEELTITRNYTGISEPWTIAEDLFGDVDSTDSFVTFTNTFISRYDRLRDIFVPFLFLWGIGAFVEMTKYDAFLSLGDIDDFTLQLNEGEAGIRLFADSYSELKDGIASYLESLEGVVSAIWADQVLTVTTFLNLANEITIDAEDSEFWIGDFDNGIVTQESTPATPSYCKYPILGLVKSVGITEVEIHTEPVCKFTSVHDGIISWNGLLDANRLFILNPGNAGYLMPAIDILNNDDFESEDVFKVFAGGYVMALSIDIDDQPFVGSFSLDLFSLQLIIQFLS